MAVIYRCLPFHHVWVFPSHWYVTIRRIGGTRNVLAHQSSGTIAPRALTQTLVNHAARVHPDDVPEATQVTLPTYRFSAHNDDLVSVGNDVPSLLADTGRSSIVLGTLGLSAIGLDLQLNCEVEDIVPNPSLLPAFTQWETFTADQAREHNAASQALLRTAKLSPGCEVYLERRRELLVGNEDAFCSVRRIAPPCGKQRPKLGNAYEFFRCLELLTAYWDDTSVDTPDKTPSTESVFQIEPDGGTAPDGIAGQTGAQQPPPGTTRIAAGDAMPVECRQNLVKAFVKLVSYDFGCSVLMARTEPRLHMASPEGENQRKSYTKSNCHFVFQSPTTAEAARAGVLHGPVAAVSTRPTVDFTSPDTVTAQSIDLAREVTAAIITAQHRRRQDQTEVRFGHDQWWTSRRRWGGGEGGPIGRENDRQDAQVINTDAQGGEAKARSAHPSARRWRKTLPIYDSFRMVRPPASTWDRKAKYEAIGKSSGVDYDDIFVVSCLFHHISILRIRVPTRLLEVLEGSPEPDTSRRSWGTVPAWRSKWHDLFDAADRIAAMRLMWCVMAYQMRAH